MTGLYRKIVGRVSGPRLDTWLTLIDTRDTDGNLRYNTSGLQNSPVQGLDDNQDRSTGPIPATSEPNIDENADPGSTDFANQTLMRLSNQFYPIIQPDADTLVYIGVPPQAPGQSDHEHEYIKHQFECAYLMRSDTLRALDSPKFLELLGPKSKRTQRRLQAARIHKSVREPEKLKYFIDLSPNIHDEEGMILLTELSVPAGARAWHKVAHRYGVSSKLVCGRDHFDIPPKPVYCPATSPRTESDGEVDPTKPNETEQKPREGLTAAKPTYREKSTKKRQKSETQDLPEEDDYSQLRHHTAIARLLHAIADGDPKLNSAAKVWTFCMLAKFFDCAKANKVNRWVTDWLVQSQNLNFIQANPSTSYRLGMAIEAVWLVKASFSIMVGQKAFADIVSELKIPDRSQWISPTHIADGLDDDDLNRVDHAASALVRRVKTTFARLVKKNGDWADCRKHGSEMATFYKLEFDSPEKQEAVQLARDQLANYVRRLLCMALVEKRHVPGLSRGLLFPTRDLATNNELPALLRLFTVPFWEQLREEKFLDDHIYHSACRKHWSDNLELFQLEGILTAEEADIPYVSRRAFFNTLDRINVKTSWPKYDIPICQGEQMELSLQATAETLKPLASTSAKIHLKPFQDAADDEIVSDLDADWNRDNRPGAAKYDEMDMEDWENIVESMDISDPTTPTQTTSLKELPLRTQPFDWQLPSGQLAGPIPSGGATTQELPIRQKHPDGRPAQAVDSNVVGAAPLSSKSRLIIASSAHSNELSARRRPTDSVVPSKFYHVSPFHANSPTNFTIGADHITGTGAYRPDARPMDAAQGESVRQTPTRIHISRGSGPRVILEDVTSPLPENNKSPSGRNVSQSNWPLETNLLDRSPPETSLLDTRPLGIRLLYTSPLETSPAQSPSPEWRPTSPAFGFTLFPEIHDHISTLVAKFLIPGFVADGSCGFDIPLSETKTLTCLTQDEYKYLPLWAGGYDDGSGGVFDDGEEIPEAPTVEDGGFRGGAIGIISGVGSSIGGSKAGSEFEAVSTEAGISTVGRASRVATDGADTIMSLDD